MYEHSLLAAEVGDELVVSEKGLSQVSVRRLMDVPHFLGDKGVALIRFRLLQMSC